jgi:photosystem I P700 chlorophyll a apoprotein A2
MRSGIRGHGNGKCVTGRFFQALGRIHDIELYSNVDNPLAFSSQIYTSHWLHLSVIFLWISGNCFHIGWNGNYELWVTNPVSIMPIAHGIWDPHFSLYLNDVYSSGGSNTAVVISYSGIYNWLYAAGFRCSFQVYHTTIAFEILSVLSLVLGRLHLYFISDLLVSAFKPRSLGMFTEWRLRLYQTCFDLGGLRLNFHIGALLGVTSVCWSGHLVHVSIPFSQGIHYSLTTLPDPMGLYPMFVGQWAHYSTTILTLLGGLKPDTSSLYLSDIAHHHLSLGVLLIWAGHVYTAFSKGFGHRIRDVSFASGSGSIVSAMLRSTHLQLSLALIGLSVATSVVAQHTYSLMPYPFLSYDYVTFTSIFVHHIWISSILMIGGFAHASIFLVRDYTVDTTSKEDLILRILLNKGSIISHLSWLCLWLGFHTLGLYIHNDSVVAFGEPEKQILIEPVFAQSIQCSSGKSLYAIHYIQSVSSSFDSIFLPLAPGDLLAHHAIALGLHVTVLICLKGSLDARGSRIMPDKLAFGYGFACDGPGRGGTCDISAWDSLYLGVFWMLNTDSWILFYFHWKHLTLNTASVFYESSTYLGGWFRDYLWFNSASLIRGYDALGANDLSVWAWLFLAAHLCWSVGFMFLISWRGYWQELVDIILFMHLRSPILYDLWTGGYYTPIALSIVQARLIGLAHFSTGFTVTYCSFIISS